MWLRCRRVRPEVQSVEYRLERDCLAFESWLQQARATFGPVFERHGVQLVLSGHDHDYQRSEVIGGVTYVVSGAGAGTRRTSSEWFTARSFSSHHFLDIAVFRDDLVLRAVNQDCRVADEVVIPRRG